MKKTLGFVANVASLIFPLIIVGVLYAGYNEPSSNLTVGQIASKALACVIFPGLGFGIMFVNGIATFFTGTLIPKTNS